MIREAFVEDYKKINELGMLIDSNFSVTSNLNELCKNPYFKILVYENNKEVVGFLMYTVLYQTIDILNVVVNESFRNEKIASNLLDLMITNASLDTKMYLEVKVSNIPAINLYKKFGFKIINTRKNYYVDTDGYVMERVII